MKRETRIEKKLVITLNQREVKEIIKDLEIRKYFEIPANKDSKEFFRMLYRFNHENGER